MPLQKQSFADVLLKNFPNFTGKHMSWKLFLIKNEALTQVFFCEIWDIFKNTSFYKTPPVAASATILTKCFFHIWTLQATLINIKKIDESILKKHDELIRKPFCMAMINLTCLCNNSIISSTIEFIISTERFSNSLV